MARLTARDKAGLTERALWLVEALQRERARPVRMTAPVAWRSLTEEELRFCWPAIEAVCVAGRGRPAGLDVLSRFEACLEAACSGVSWREAQVAGMKGDTLHRCFRRWAAAGLWMRLLLRLAAAQRRSPGKWAALECYVCRAYRLAGRVQGLRGIVLARRLGMGSAVRAPLGMLPDPILSARFHQRFILPGLAVVGRMPWPAARSFLRVTRQLLGLCGGALRVRREWEPA